MYVLASSTLYDRHIHGPNGPHGHYMVDVVWTLAEFRARRHERRVERHQLCFGLVELYEYGVYGLCVHKSHALRILQRKIKARYA